MDSSFFRPNYGSKNVVTTTSIQPITDQKDSSISKNTTFYKTEKTSEDRAKLLTARIKKIETVFEFFKLFQSFNSIDFSFEQNEFNSQHWACWFQQFSKKVTYLRDEDRDQILKIVGQFQKCLENKTIDLLQPVQNAVIVTALNQLAIKNTKLVDYLYQNALLHIEEYSIKEIVMLMNGGRDFFSKQQLKQLLDRIEMKWCVRKLVDIQTLSPHAIASVLRSCAQCEKVSLLTKTLCERAKQVLSTFSLIESIDLIAGLRDCCYTKEGIYLLKQIEIKVASELKKEDHCSKSLIITMKHFADVRYLPSKLLDLVSTYLLDQSTNTWDKMSLFSAFAMLGYHEFRPHFEGFVSTLTSICVKKSKPIWQTIYPRDLYSILYAAACFCSPKKALPDPLQLIATYLIEKIDQLDVQQRLGFGEILCALKLSNDHTQYLPREIPENDAKSTRAQQRVMKSVQEWIQSQGNLGFLEIFPELDIGGRSIDFVIASTKKINGKEFKPIACEVDSHYHFCCNDPLRPLGKNLIRNHLLRTLGFTLFIIRGKPKGQTVSIKQVTNELKKWQ